MVRALRLLCGISLSLSLLSGIAGADPPDAGTLLNEQRQPGSRLPGHLPKPEQRGIQRAQIPESGVKVIVKAFRFTGAGDIATDSELQALVADSIGKRLGFAELQAVA